MYVTMNDKIRYQTLLFTHLYPEGAIVGQNG